MTPRKNASAAPEVRARRSAHGEPAPLPAAFYARPAEAVARELLGATIVSEAGGVRVSAEIVETEAYVGPEDEASHAAERFGRTARNDAMFGPAGTAYVYLIYGMHWCLNFVTGDEGFGAAVLVRAARPVDGIEHARARRPGRPDHELMRGPGNLARALGVDAALNRHPLDRPPLWIAPGRPIAEADVAVGPRIGISRAADWPLRFWLRGDPHVSGKS
ncbi:MAG TPA: DNA-3-methyladenine glycosylase [Longimicrobium sp.]|uniref:DNA-3-methyladenine glycosylase n=1 Tax=Longimicrobium sp. TaxID=2029185 RepID=UPI002ED916BC